MEIGTRDIYEFGGKFIDILTGDPATPDEIEQFTGKLEKQREERAILLAEQVVVRKQIDEEFQEKYAAHIQKYFTYKPGRWDDESLVYHMSTHFFDVCTTYYEGGGNSDDYYEFMRTFVGWSDEDRVYLNGLRSAFGDDIYDRAWAGFLDGDHDT